MTTKPNTTFKLDPISMQVIRYAMERIADEMGYTMVRTSRSIIIKEIMDITCAVSDSKGETIAQAHHAPMLLTGFEITTRALLDHFDEEDLHDGDVIISNDPYKGGQHIMDLQTFTPVRFDRRLIGLVASIAHHADMGGATAGGVAGGLTEIYQEGLRLPMVKLYREGAECDEIFGIIANNIRVPEKTLGDIRAQASANFVGARRMKEIYEKYGPEVVEGCCEMLKDYSERRIRAGLKKIPDGTYTGVDYVDDDGVRDEPVRIQVNIHKQGDHAKIDFEGTAPQAPGNINCPLATTHAAVYYALLCVIDPHVPPNAGCYRPFQVEVQEGSCVNPRMPGAVAARTNTSQKIAEAMMKALAQAVPAQVTAGSHGQISTCGFSGFQPKTNKRFVFIDIQGGGAGAMATKDGRDGQDSHLARFMNTPVESAEMEYPVRVERYALIPDSGGAGQYRGALAPRRDTRMLVDGISFARYGDRQAFAPFGLFGGKDGAMGRFYLTRRGEEPVRLKSKGFDTLSRDDVVSICCPGAGGYGDPLGRNLDALERDLLDGKVTPERAVEDYQVVVDAKTLRIDRAATAKARSDG